MNNYPVYIDSHNNGRLKKTISTAFAMLQACCLCPHRCGANRLKGITGICKTGLNPYVYSYMPHHGEEPPVSGTAGSGTIFFANCNMKCVYCQNYEFSQLGQGKETGTKELAQIMLELQQIGCHNINLVTPTHVMPQILAALEQAILGGLRIPLVYNTGGYELPGVIKLLEGVIDIYLADMRYGDSDIAKLYSSAAGYAEYNQESVRQMHNQVGIAKINENGLIERGLIIRHLVLPNGASGTKSIMKFIRDKISQDSYISLMSQYLPYYNASKFPDISRRLYNREYEFAKQVMESYGLSNGWIQESYGSERFAGVHIKPAL